MRRTRTGRRFTARLLALAALGCTLTYTSSCTLTTQGDPEIPMVTIPNTFVAAISGAADGAIDGPATIFAASDPSPRTVELVNSDNPAMRVVFEKGLLGSSTFDFAEGEYSLAGFPGFREVDAFFYLSSAEGDLFSATSGSFVIVTSGPGIIRGRFNFTGTAISGAATRQVRVRGTFWAVPESP